jgi:biopolymer transport protein ExbD
MKKRTKITINHNSEFELDLAPLLAVMVKLVPVLLISSAFVQMMVIETELPQVVSEAIQRQENETKPTTISIGINETRGFEVTISKDGRINSESVPLVNGSLDFDSFHKKMIAIKTSNPEVFKVDLNPDASITYNQLVKIMDELRHPHDSNIKFPVMDQKKGIMTETNYMFPEVTFANMMEGSENDKTTSL